MLVRTSFLCVIENSPSMEESPQKPVPLAAGSDRPKKNTEEYGDFISGDIIVLSVVDSIKTKTIPLLTFDVKSRKLIGISREGMEEALKSSTSQ